MKRVEIIANRSIEDNIMEALRTKGLAKFYTKYPIVLGEGSSGARLGDAIWPEENFVLVVWCEDEEARQIEQAVQPVKEQYPSEGVKVFCL
ncbi:MAG: hypothetical protein LBD22_02380 [Spirochaetaceae bacterium]|jgi:hypothetical protein|nr:hypothetical protein [Spirochaetaceae bacterium]